MRNLILTKETFQENDTDKEDSKGDLSSYNFNENHNRKIVDLRQSLRDRISRREIFCSFEIVSVKKPVTFYQRLLAEMDKYSPLFYALTWHNETSDSYLPLNIAEHFPSNTLLHLAAKGLKRNQVVDILKRARNRGIINIFALQGDSLSENGDFKYAQDLVAFIREQFGDTFCICVAGYPQMHAKSSSKELDLHYLKAKIEAGANFIITQIIFESQVFVDFVNDCRVLGIQVPIIPGIFVPTSYESLERMADICKFDVPVQIKEHLARLKSDDEEMKQFALKTAVQIITDIIESGTTCGFHLFTLNRYTDNAK